MSQLYSHCLQPCPQQSGSCKNPGRAEAETQWAVLAQAFKSWPIRADWAVQVEVRQELKQSVQTRANNRSAVMDRMWKKKVVFNIKASYHFLLDTQKKKDLNLEIRTIKDFSACIWLKSYSIPDYFHDRILLLTIIFCNHLPKILQ